jgi:hypothetical protein
MVWYSFAASLNATGVLVRLPRLVPILAGCVINLNHRLLKSVAIVGTERWQVRQRLQGEHLITQHGLSLLEFAECIGSVRGGEAAAIILSFVESAKLHQLNPYAYLRDVLTRLPSAKARDLDSLLPHLWQAYLILLLLT